MKSARGSAALQRARLRRHLRQQRQERPWGRQCRGIYFFSPISRLGFFFSVCALAEMFSGSFYLFRLLTPKKGGKNFVQLSSLRNTHT